MYFLANPTLPTLIYSQQLVAGANHFVLLAIPFFVLAGVAMEANGMSSRLIELLVRMMGRLRGGLNLIIIVAVAFFSGVSGSKLADIAAVGGIIMPAVRRTKQDPNEAAGLLACSGVMAETIPPCINMIIFGFVASISIGGLFMAGLVPALILALALAAVAIYTGKKVDPSAAFPERRPMLRLLGGALVALIMIADDRQRRDVGRRDVDRGLRVRGRLRVRRRRSRVSRADVADHRAAFRAVRIDDRQHPVHRRGGLRPWVRAHDRAHPEPHVGRR